MDSLEPSSEERERERAEVVPIFHNFHFFPPRIKVIGKGGFGSVYECNIHSQPTAVKAIQQPTTIRSQQLTHKVIEQVTGIRSEALSQADMAHPNIVPIREHWFQQIDGVTYLMLAMELCKCNMSQWIEEQVFDFAQMVGFILDLSAATKFIAEKGKIHRDIKLQNVLVTVGNNPTAKLSDFGLVDQSGGTPGLCGIEHFDDPQGGFYFRFEKKNTILYYILVQFLLLFLVFQIEMKIFKKKLYHIDY